MVSWQILEYEASTQLHLNTTQSQLKLLSLALLNSSLLTISHMFKDVFTWYLNACLPHVYIHGYTIFTDMFTLYSKTLLLKTRLKRTYLSMLTQQKMYHFDTIFEVTLISQMGHPCRFSEKWQVAFIRTAWISPSQPIWGLISCGVEQHQHVALCIAFHFIQKKS